MTGLFERALGEEWSDLHPKLRERYGVVAADDEEVIGRGVMTELSPSRLAAPVLWLGTRDDFLFPERGTDVPFTITTEAFVDDAGNEALFLERAFETDPPRQFVDTLRWNPARECITDLLGAGGRVVSDLHLGVDDGALTLELGTQWLRIAGRYVRLPGPLAVEGTLRDWYDDAAAYNVAAEIRNPVFTVFNYRGHFENERRPADSDQSTRSRLGDVALPTSDA